MHVKQEEAIVGFDHADHARGNDLKPPEIKSWQTRYCPPLQPSPGSYPCKLDRSGKVELHLVGCSSSIAIDGLPEEP